MKLTLRQCPFSPKNDVERKTKMFLEGIAQEDFVARIARELQIGIEFPFIAPVTGEYPTSQNFSKYRDMPYGETGTIGGAGCGPLAIEYSLRVMGIEVDFEDIVCECVGKGYRGYRYDEQDNIIGGCGTENEVFDLAESLGSISRIIAALKKGYMVTVLVANKVYHSDTARSGNHFISLVGIDAEGNALFMDGNMITDVNRPEEAFVVRPFKYVATGFKGAWAWNPEKIMESLY